MKIERVKEVLGAKSAEMTEERWHKHTPGNPMPTKCGDSMVEVKMRHTGNGIGPSKHWKWEKLPFYPDTEITEWRFIERKGEDVIAADTYDAESAIRSAARRANIEVPG